MFLFLISHPSVYSTRETSNAGTPRESNVLCRYPPKACTTTEKHKMQPLLPGNHCFCPDDLPNRVKHKRNVKCKHSTRIPVVALIPSPSVQNPKEMPRHQFWWSDILSKRVKNKRNVQCVHPQGIKFVVLMSSQSMQNKRDVKCGHCLEINFVVLISFRST